MWAEGNPEPPLCLIITIHARVENNPFPADPKRCHSKSGRKSPISSLCEAENRRSLLLQNNSGQKASLHGTAVSFHCCGARFGSQSRSLGTSSPDCSNSRVTIPFPARGTAGCRPEGQRGNDRVPAQRGLPSAAGGGGGTPRDPSSPWLPPALVVPPFASCASPPLGRLESCSTVPRRNGSCCGGNWETLRLFNQRSPLQRHASISAKEFSPSVRTFLMLKTFSPQKNPTAGF